MTSEVPGSTPPETPAPTQPLQEQGSGCPVLAAPSGTFGRRKRPRRGDGAWSRHLACPLPTLGVSWVPPAVPSVWSFRAPGSTRCLSTLWRDHGRRWSCRRSPLWGGPRQQPRPGSAGRSRGLMTAADSVLSVRDSLCPADLAGPSRSPGGGSEGQSRITAARMPGPRDGCGLPSPSLWAAGSRVTLGPSFTAALGLPVPQVGDSVFPSREAGDRGHPPPPAWSQGAADAHLSC